VRHFIVDWENKGKVERQQGFDTQINVHGVAELRALRRAVGGVVSCRVNSLGPWTAQEIDDALAAGATTLFLPMVKSPERGRPRRDAAGVRLCPRARRLPARDGLRRPQ
jgi:citrate lyase beta subunit